MLRLLGGLARYLYLAVLAIMIVALFLACMLYWKITLAVGGEIHAAVSVAMLLSWFLFLVFMLRGESKNECNW